MILSTQLKVNLLHVEMWLQSHPVFEGAVAFGEGKGSCGLLLE